MMKTLLPFLLPTVGIANPQQPAETRSPATSAQSPPVSDQFHRAFNGDENAFADIKGSAERGDGESQALLGLLYSSVPDSTLALQWLHKAAAQDNTRGLVVLGLIYNEGPMQDGQRITQGWVGRYGVPRDYEQAMHFFLRAAELGDQSGQYELGEMYCYGLGAPKDAVTAYKWLNLAASRSGGYAEPAQRERDRLETEMTREQVAQAQRLSREWKPMK